MKILITMMNDKQMEAILFPDAAPITVSNFVNNIKHNYYMGKRIKRGLFKQSSGKVLNADLNGAIGILRKVINESDFNRIIDRGFVINPVRVNPLTKDFIKILY